MNISGERAYALMKRLSFIRPMGTQEEKRAAELICGEIAELGLTPVREDFQVTLGSVKTETFKVTAPFQKNCNVKAGRLCGNTPAQGISVPFAYVDKLTEDNAAAFTGKAVLMNDCAVSFEKMAKANIACAVFCLGKANEEPDMTGPMIRKEEERDKLPIFYMATADALELVQRGARTVHFAVIGEKLEATSQNVIVELPSTENNKEVVAFGAHYDSVPCGPGASDNAGGSVILMELLRYYQENPARQTLRFIWFGGEEEGFHGSKAYLEKHAAELEAYRLMINIDVAGSIIGKNFVRATCEESVAHAIQFIADELGYQADIKQGLMGSDSTPFADKKVPAIGFGRGAAHGLEFAHSRFDTPEYCSAQALEGTGRFIADYTRRVLDAKIFPIPRSIPENIVKRVNEMLGKPTEP